MYYGASTDKSKKVKMKDCLVQIVCDINDSQLPAQARKWKTAFAQIVQYKCAANNEHNFNESRMQPLNCNAHRWEHIPLRG